MVGRSATYAQILLLLHKLLTTAQDQERQHGPDPPLDGIHHNLLVGVLTPPPTTTLTVDRDYADFTIPKPFSTRVQNALKAEPTSVKLSSLVGSGGLWYGFGRMIMSL